MRIILAPAGRQVYRIDGLRANEVLTSAYRAGQTEQVVTYPTSQQVCQNDTPVPILFQVRQFVMIKNVPKCPAVSRSYDYTAVLAIGMKIATIVVMKQGLRNSNGSGFCNRTYQ